MVVREDYLKELLQFLVNLRARGIALFGRVNLCTGASPVNTSMGMGVGEGISGLCGSVRLFASPTSSISANLQ